MVPGKACVLGLIIAFHAVAYAAAPQEVFSAAEKARLAAETSLDGRIKIYDAASRNLYRELHSGIRRGQFETIPDKLQTWTALLQASLADIEAHANSRKKSKKLIKYEIHLRQSINDLLELRAQAPVEQQDAFNACIAQAEAVRKKFIGILFPH